MGFNVEPVLLLVGIVAAAAAIVNFALIGLRTCTRNALVSQSVVGLMGLAFLIWLLHDDARNLPLAEKVVHLATGIATAFWAVVQTLWGLAHKTR